MPATGAGEVFMPQDTTCRGRLRQMDTPLLRYYTPGSDPDLDSPDEVVDFAYDSPDRKSTTTDARGATNFAYDDYQPVEQGRFRRGQAAVAMAGFGGR